MVNHLVNSKYIASKYLDDLRDNPKWEVPAMINKIKRDLGAEIYNSKCYRAKAITSDSVQGEVNAQYHRLWDYGQTIMKTNPGSMVKLKTDLQRFHERESVPREINFPIYVCQVCSIKARVLHWNQAIDMLRWLPFEDKYGRPNVMCSCKRWK